MLNCTDLACVLHHHHFYAHLHHLKHHLQDDNEYTGFSDGSDLGNTHKTETTINASDPDLASLYRVDAPNDVIYTICGVVIAMLMVGVIIILVAVTINKLRKRDESSTIVTPNSNESAQQQQQQNGVNQQQLRTSNSHSIIVEQRQQQQQQQQLQQQHQTTKLQAAYNSASVLESGTYNNNNNNGIISTDKNHVSFVRTSGKTTTTDTSNWVFPPKEPSPNIYHCFTTDALVAVNESNGFKGFRKQFSGRFKRLVARKPNTPSPAIPPELKPQLKSIYVY